MVHDSCECRMRCRGAMSPERASAPSSRRDRFRPRILDLGARFEVRDDSGFDRSPPYPKLDQTHHSARSKHFGASRRDRDDVLDTLRAASHPHAPRTVMGLREGRGPIANAIGIAAGITIGGVIVKASPPADQPPFPPSRSPAARRDPSWRSPPPRVSPHRAEDELSTGGDVARLNFPRLPLSSRRKTIEVTLGEGQTVGELSCASTSASTPRRISASPST